MDSSEKFWLIVLAVTAAFLSVMSLIIAVHDYEKTKMMAEQGLVEVWDPVGRGYVWKRAEDSK